MEHRAYNILRHGKYRIETIPSEALYMAHLLAEKRRDRKQRTDRLINRGAAATIVLTAGYLGYHLALWALR